MIKEQNQSWKVGDEVKVGFTRLRVTGCRQVKDGLPDIYTLESIDGTRKYEFIPYNGLRRTDNNGSPKPKKPRLPKARVETKDTQTENRQEPRKESIWKRLVKPFTADLIAS